LKQIVKNIFLILNKREKARMDRLILLDVIMSILDISFLAMLLYVIHFYTTGQHSIQTSSPFTILNKYPLLLIICFFILFSIKNLCGVIVFRSQTRFVYGVASRLSGKNLLNYLDGSYKDYVDVDSSVHIRKISQQPIEFCHYVLGGFQQIISQCILISITIIAILIYNAALFPLLFIILAPPVFVTGLLMKRKLNTIRKTAKVTSEKALQHLNEAISSFIESNVYNKKDFFLQRYFNFQNKFNGFLADQQVIQNIPSRIMEVFAVFGLFVLIVINSVSANNGAVQVLAIGAFMAAAYKIIPGIVKILNSVGQIKTYRFTMHDLLLYQELPAMKNENRNKINSIEFSNVSFGYNEEKIINNFSAKMNAGELIGITGLSGKGKTTIINLLLGFLKPTSGEIIINEQISDDIALQQYWNKITYVKQQPFFIHDSILKNIILQENNYDNKKLATAITATGLDKIINTFNEGPATLITENGKNFSGGQRQRIILARALYKDFDVLILDEPFSELDEEAEKQLLNYFSKISGVGIRVTLITQSKTALSFCNKIISLDE
jgi:ABC-type bacteriocin/lantibiotic exporter with double-glycine peptidase domain